MGNLLASLGSSADAMEAMQRALNVVQNNVTNASTPGYARQRINLEAERFELGTGLLGGVDASNLINSRTGYLETAVRSQVERWGRFAQQTDDLSQVEPIFDIAGGAGIAGALDDLYQSFSQWSVAPNHLPSRQTVIQRAQSMAQAFNFTATSLSRLSNNADTQLRTTVSSINAIAERIRGFNTELRRDSRAASDPGLDAQIHVALEELSELADVTVLKQDDGSYSIYLGGQTPLALGDSTYPIGTDFSGPQAKIVDAQGNDITGQIQQGRLRGTLDFRNSFLPSVRTELNTLAQTVADRVNTLLAAGVDMNGQPPAVNLFSYNAGAGAAFTLAVTAIQPDQLAAATTAAPGGNANALALASLATSKEIGGFSFSEYYGNIAARAGRSLATARQDARTQELLVSQARTQRSEVSAVSLDEEAAYLVQFQRNYQAAAEMFRVINEMTESMIGLLR